MIHSLILELDSRHVQTGKRMRRYRIVVGCSCRLRAESRSVPFRTAKLSLRCGFCGDETTANLLEAQPGAPLRKRAGAVLFQETRCAHPECGEIFDFEYRASDGARRYEPCEHCGTIKVMRRKSAA